MFTLICDSVRFIQRTLKAAGLSGNGKRDSIQDVKDAIKVSYIEEYYYCHHNCRPRYHRVNFKDQDACLATGACGID